MFFAFRRRRLSYWLLQRHNLFVEMVLRFSTFRHLPRSVMAAYRAPFPDPRSRYPIRVFPGELPLNDRDTEARRAIEEIENGLDSMAQPMLLLHFHPGAVLGRSRVAWLTQRLPDLEVVDGGRGLHYVPEDRPERIAEALDDWLRRRLPEPVHESPPTPVVAAEDDRYGGPLTWAFAATEHGDMVAAWSPQGLVMLSFADDAEDGRAQVARRFPRPAWRPAMATPSTPCWRPRRKRPCTWWAPLSARRLARPARHSRRPDPPLRRTGPRPEQPGPGGGQRRGQQPHRPAGTLPPGGAPGRRPGRLPLGRGAQEGAAGRGRRQGTLNR